MTIERSGSAVRHDGGMVNEPRADRPRRRSFSPAEKLRLLAGYEAAMESGGGNAFLRENGLYSSLISEWRRTRDAGLLRGKPTGAVVGRPNADQAEIARLRRQLEVAQRRLARTPSSSGDHGKSSVALGGSLRERGHAAEVDRVMLGAYTQLRVVVSHRAAAGLSGVSRATAHRREVLGPVRPPVVRPVPVNQLRPAERAQILAVLNSDRFVDTAPVEVFATLLDEGVYLASVATMYRVLRANRQVVERRRLARHPARKRPELIATGPGQVFTWDITKLPGPGRGLYYDAYVMIDIYSRYIVGWKVAASESAELAEGFIADVFATHGVPQVVHADRGTSMTSKKVADLLADLHVVRSHSRPHVSNDNPFSEAAFKTVKYHPTFPRRFGSIQDARAFCETFFMWYNHEHHHSGVGLHTPAAVHYGHASALTVARQRVLDIAWMANPERFGHRPEPKALRLPDIAWINRPEPATDQPETLPHAA